MTVDHLYAVTDQLINTNTNVFTSINAFHENVGYL